MLDIDQKALLLADIAHRVGDNPLQILAHFYYCEASGLNKWTLTTIFFVT